MKNKQILITGGAGYSGSLVVLALCDSGYDVTVFDDDITTQYLDINSDSEEDTIIIKNGLNLKIIIYIGI